MTRSVPHGIHLRDSRRCWQRLIASFARPWAIAPTGESTDHPSREAGAVLILALVFLVVVSVIIGGLTDWTTNDLRNTLSFNATQTNNSSATNAVDLAIQNIRYTPLLFNSVNGTTVAQTLNASPPNYCWGTPGTTPPPFSQAFNMNVYCSTVWNPTSANTRQVTVSACPTFRTPGLTGIASWTAAQTSCPAQPLLQAVVTLDDYPNGVSGPSQAQCVVYCGSGLIINSWNFAPVVPTITSATGLVNPPNTSINGGQPIVIRGTDFTSGTTLNFVNTSPLAQLASTSTQQVQQIVPATQVSVNVGTQTITAQSPGVTTLANYFVTVTTPGGGTSATNSNFEFKYTSVAPAVTSVTPTSGYTTHSTFITITGSGFINGAKVCMVEENGGTPVSPSTCSTYPASAVEVVSNTVITALTYPYYTATPPQSFFVQVTTAGGATPVPVPNDTFTYTTAPP